MSEPPKSLPQRRYVSTQGYLPAGQYHSYNMINAVRI